MPNKKLTDSEIVKALEYCLKDGYEKCKKCQYYGTVMCTTELLSNALDLINRLQAENERLKDFTSSKCEDCAGCTSWKCDCANIEAQAKAEAYKECIEKVKEEIYSQPHSRSLEASVERARIIKIFDNLLKEMVGEDNA